MLSDRSIFKEIEKGDLQVTPFDSRLVQPASLDLLLGDSFYTIDVEKVKDIDPTTSQPDMMHESKADPLFVLDSHEFALATTIESVKLPDYIMGVVAGKSSLARLGLQIECAGFIDPGFEGEITLELYNMAPVPLVLYPNMPIAQISFDYLSISCERPYGDKSRNSKYLGQKGPTMSQYYKNNIG